MAPRVIITEFPTENSKEGSKDQIKGNSNESNVFDWHCQLKEKLRNLDQLRVKVQGHPKNPSPMSRPHQPQPFFTNDEMYGMDSIHGNDSMECKKDMGQKKEGLAYTKVLCSQWLCFS